MLGIVCDCYNAFLGTFVCLVVRLLRVLFDVSTCVLFAQKRHACALFQELVEIRAQLPECGQRWFHLCFCCQQALL